MSNGSQSFSSFSLYVSADSGADAWVVCHRYPSKTPILAIDAGKSSVTISIKGRDATESAVEFARSLARQAQAFADEMERLHAGATTPESADTAEQAA